MVWDKGAEQKVLESVLMVDNLSVRRSGKLIISDINLKINRGEFVGLVGPNGSGKSTLILTILGILKANTGAIRIYDQKPMSKDTFGKIGWVSQAASYLPNNIKITVRELVRLGTLKSSSIPSRNILFSIFDSFSFIFSLVFSMFAGNRIPNQEDKVDTAMKMVGIDCCADCNISTLSGGQRQRAVIARALASEAEFILLDEPLVGIDRDSRNSLLELLDRLCHEQGKTILMVSHDIAAIRQSAHRMVYLEETIRFDGPTEEFPDLNTLAALRGITPVHNFEHGIEPHDHTSMEE